MLKKVSRILLTVLCGLLLCGCSQSAKRRIFPLPVNPSDLDSKERYYYMDEFNRAQEPVSEQSWDRAIPFEHGVGIVVENNRWGAVDEKCNYITEPQWDYVGPIDPVSGLMKVELDGKAGYINRNGELVLALMWDYDACQSFAEGLAAVEDENGLWGYMNAAGQIVIDYQWERCDAFSEGKAAVHQYFDYGYINQKGEIVIPMSDWRNVEPFHGGMACVRTNENELWGIINEKGQYIIEPRYTSASWHEDSGAWHLTGLPDSPSYEYLTVYADGRELCYVLSYSTDLDGPGSSGTLDATKTNHIW